MAAIAHIEPLSYQTLSTLIDRVRNNIADVPVEMLDTIIIYESLKRANKMVSKLVMADDVDLPYQKECIVALGTLFAYQSYLAIAAQRLGNIPESAEATKATYQAIARALMHPVADMPLNADLTQDDKWLSTVRVAAAVKGSTTLDLPIQNDAIYR